MQAFSSLSLSPSLSLVIFLFLAASPLPSVSCLLDPPDWILLTIGSGSTLRPSQGAICRGKRFPINGVGCATRSGPGLFPSEGSGAGGISKRSKQHRTPTRPGPPPLPKYKVAFSFDFFSCQERDNHPCIPHCIPHAEAIAWRYKSSSRACSCMGWWGWGGSWFVLKKVLENHLVIVFTWDDSRKRP